MELDARGFIRVNERLETTAPGVWAIGECAGSPQFTHVSVDDFRIVRDNMAGGNRRTDDRQIPYVMFTDPPLARVGLSEGEAQRQGIPLRVARLPMSQVLRTEATDETTGFMKVLVSANDDRILGFTMIGSEAGEVMAAVQIAMLAGCLTRSCATPSSRTLRWPKAWARFSPPFRGALLDGANECSRCQGVWQGAPASAWRTLDGGQIKVNPYESVIGGRHDQAFPLTDSDISRIERFGERRQYHRGERVFAAGERTPGMFVVLKGTLTMSSRDGLGLTSQVVRHDRVKFHR